VTQKYIIKVFINGTLVSQKVNYDARDFLDVKLYLGDPWHSPRPNVLITDFEYGIL
jgi:hypothetical protein